jgi:hypothetical protein
MHRTICRLIFELQLLGQEQFITIFGVSCFTLWLCRPSLFSILHSSPPPLTHVPPPPSFCTIEKQDSQKAKQNVIIKKIGQRRWTWTGYFKCREVKTRFYRNRSMQTGSSGTLIGWKSGQTTFVPLWDRIEGAWLRTQERDLEAQNPISPPPHLILYVYTVLFMCIHYCGPPLLYTYSHKVEPERRYEGQHFTKLGQK